MGAINGILMGVYAVVILGRMLNLMRQCFFISTKCAADL